LCCARRSESLAEGCEQEDAAHVLSSAASRPPRAGLASTRYDVRTEAIACSQGKGGSKLYVTIGSSSNVDVETDPEERPFLEMNPDGTDRRIFASGTRNGVGLAFYPGTSELWAAVEERDRLGDDLVPDYLVNLRDGGFYGWPFAYLGPHPDLRRQGERPDLVAKTLPPDVLFQAHSAVLGLMFYDGAMFPSDWKGDAIVAMHGSWNRSQRTGYKLVRIPFRSGRPIGGYDDFVTGWMRDPAAAELWGRPVGLLQLGDGSLLVSDDGGAKVWRILYSPGAATFGGSSS
jgi:glucose/arabinose dehydrogenase